MKLLKMCALVVLSALSTSVFATNHQVESDGYDVMIDMILRPVGLVATVIGAGVFVGVSPLTALATIPPPHDAFEKLADTIVCKPFKYTFMRPVGDYRYDKGCKRDVPPPIAQPVVPYVAPAPVVEQPEPQVQLPEEPNKKLDAIFKKEMMK